MSRISIFVAHDLQFAFSDLESEFHSEISLKSSLDGGFCPEFSGGSLEFVFTSFVKAAAVYISNETTSDWQSASLDSSGSIPFNSESEILTFPFVRFETFRSKHGSFHAFGQLLTD